MARFSNKDQLTEFVRGRRMESSSMRMDIARSTGRAQSYYHGMQWLYGGHSSGQGFEGFKQLRRDLAPDSRALRVVVNRTNRFIPKIAAFSHPKAVDMDVSPAEGDYGAEARRKSDVLEVAASALLKDSGFLRHAQAANFNRSLAGQWVIGFAVEMKAREVGDKKMSDSRLRAFNAPAHRISVDPFSSEKDLTEHEEVIYSDIRTIHRLKRDFGEKVERINENDLKQVGDLTPVEQEFYRISGGRLYGNYHRFSKTKGAVVHQVHVKDSRGMFTEMYTLVDLGGGKMVWMDEGREFSPFGGHGLPFFMLRAHNGGDSARDTSDFDLLKDDQDGLNIAMTHSHRIIQQNAYWNWVVNRKWFGNKSSDDDIRAAFSNRVGGAIIGDAPASRASQAPQLVQAPQIPASLDNMAAYREGSMREQSFRSEGNLGGTKSHVPDASFQKAIQEADQVLGIRVQQDVMEYERAIEMVLGTGIRMAKEKVPSTLVTLRKAGFDGDDFAVLMSEDDEQPACKIKVREGTVRHRSYDAKRVDLQNAAQQGQIEAPDFRAAMADLDAPLTDSDKSNRQYANRVAVDVMAGMPFEPLPLGIDGGTALLRALRHALMDRRVQKDPEAKARLVEAIELQEQMMLGPAVQEQGPPPIPEALTPDQALAQALGPQLA